MREKIPITLGLGLVTVSFSTVYLGLVYILGLGLNMAILGLIVFVGGLVAVIKGS